MMSINNVCLAKQGILGNWSNNQTIAIMMYYIVFSLSLFFVSCAPGTDANSENIQITPPDLSHLPRDKKGWIEHALSLEENLEQPINILQYNAFRSSPTHSNYYQPVFQRHLDAISNSRLSVRNKLQLLPNGASFRFKIASIQKAKKSIYATYYQIRCDAAGREFTNVLIAAKKRGVDVKIIVDGDYYYSVTQIAPCDKELRKNGVGIYFTPRPFLGIAGKTFLLHDKLIVIDLQHAIVGGQNIASWWSESNGMDDNFRDIDVDVQGPAVIDIAKRFVKLFNIVSPKNIALLNDYNRQIHLLENSAKELGHIGQQHYASWLSSKQPVCRYVTQTPLSDEDQYNITWVYHALTKEAQRRVVMQVPQFNPFGSEPQQILYTSLKDLAERGRVDLITNGVGYIRANIIRDQGFLRYIHDMLGYNLGGKIIAKGLFNNGGFLGTTYDGVKGSQINTYIHSSWVHGKVFLFDQIAVSIGSFNLDESSVTWTEDALICMDPNLVKAVEAELTKDFSLSKLMPRP